MKATVVKQIHAREILDSRGNPTVAASVMLEDGSIGNAAVPSGASTGTHEAAELRDGDKRYGGKGVQKAVQHVNTKIHRLIVGKDALHQRAIDQAIIALDGTPNKSKLGANAILAVSLATARAAALSQKLSLYRYLRKAYKIEEKKWKFPLLTMNVLNGGRHANNGLAIQECMIVPLQSSVKERVRVGSEIFHTLASILEQKKYSTGVGDEGGFAPELMNNEHAFRLLMLAIERAGYVPGKHVALATDMAASEFFRKGRYYLDGPRHPIDGKDMIQTVVRWSKKFPFISIEDPLAEDDWEHWQDLTRKIGKHIALVGDDLFVTNMERIQKGIDMSVANAVLIKLNQIGSLSETIDAIMLARSSGYQVSVSHRSGETADTFIADLAVAVNAEYMKTGSLSRSERVEKYNRLMEIEEEVG